MKLFMIVFLGYGINLFAADLGKVLYVQNNVNIMRAGKSEELKLKSGDIIQEGDRVAAGPNSRAKIAMLDSRNIINILPDSKITFTQLSLKDRKSAQMQINLIEGRIRTHFKDKLSDSSKFEIRTLNSVIGIRGTDFLVSFDSASMRTEVLTFEGTVSFRSLASLLKSFQKNTEVLVGASQRSSNIKDSMPSANELVNPVELKKINEDTTVLTEAEQKALDQKSSDKKKKNKNKKESDSPSSSEGSRGN